MEKTSTTWVTEELGRLVSMLAEFDRGVDEVHRYVSVIKRTHSDLKDFLKEANRDVWRAEEESKRSLSHSIQTTQKLISQIWIATFLAGAISAVVGVATVEWIKSVQKSPVHEVARFKSPPMKSLPEVIQFGPPGLDR